MKWSAMKWVGVAAGVVAAFGIAGLVTNDPFWQQVLTLTLLWATAGMAWNLPASVGQISLGHSTFTGIGAYTFVLLYAKADVSPWLGMLAGMVLAAVVAIVVGLPTFRLTGFYFTLATMALPLIAGLIVVHAGYPEVTVPLRLDRGLWAMQFVDQRMYVWISLGLFALTMAIGLLLEHSEQGKTLRGIRDNEILARSVGIRTLPRKTWVFALSAALSAAVGVIWVNAVLLVVTAEEVFGLSVVILMLSVTFIGGIGTTWGPIVGAAILVPLGQVLTVGIGDRVPGAETLVYGLALVAAAVLVPRGIVPTIQDWLRHRRIDRSQLAEEIVGSEEQAESTPLPAVLQREGVKPDGDRLLVVEGLKKRFGGLVVLEDVNLEIEPGARLGLIGPNGAGKTTLFNLLTGHLIPDGGTVVYDGTDIGRLHAPDRVRLGIARTFQVPRGFTSMTPRENVEVSAVGARLGADVGPATEAALWAVGLRAKADVPLDMLTTFDFKLLELARAIVSRPRLLLLDEPLAGLNSGERDKFFARLDHAVDDQTAVVVIEHSVRSLIAFANELVALDQGRMIARGTPEEVVANPRVVEAYLGRRWAEQARAAGGEEGNA